MYSDVNVICIMPVFQKLITLQPYTVTMKRENGIIIELWKAIIKLSYVHINEPAYTVWLHCYNFIILAFKATTSLQSYKEYSIRRHCNYVL